MSAIASKASPSRRNGGGGGGITYGGLKEKRKMSILFGVGNLPKLEAK